MCLRVRQSKKAAANVFAVVAAVVAAIAAPARAQAGQTMDGQTVTSTIVSLVNVVQDDGAENAAERVV